MIDRDRNGAKRRSASEWREPKRGAGLPTEAHDLAGPAFAEAPAGNLHVYATAKVGGDRRGAAAPSAKKDRERINNENHRDGGTRPVSYTHLTLPTIYSV